MVDAMSRTLAIAGALTALMLLAGCTAGGGPDRPRRTSVPEPTGLTRGESAPTGTPRDVLTGLDAPWSVVLHDDVVLLSERDSGAVLEMTADGTRTVGTVPGVRHGGEGGLLGLAVRDDDLFVYSTATDGNRIERFPLRGGPGALALGTPTTILDGLPANTFHDGGRIAFGPDGMLFASVGDAGVPTDAQDRSSLAGKILRMTPDGDVPMDNPFDGSLVWSLGHRNVQGLGWLADGRMVAAEFGQDDRDELNVIEPGSNHGWPEVEGTGGTSRGFVDPVQEWATDDASPSGLAVIGDTVFVANLRGAMVRGIPASDLGSSHEYFAGEYGRIRTVLAAPTGDALWFVTNNTDGRGDPRAGDDRIVSVDLSR
ncbi:PQQ-dependent sugar dehydrogenase [Curtobacterium sp. RRHDQ10]|uniref:PQQ-dependent sugar dehydrogenase n=1 Tax=Curtobacterium phyllosphaerae TaxID=3413379 RepID=UPI003BF2DB3C